MTAEPEPPGRGRPDQEHPEHAPPAPLPAPYRSPWRRLADDLRDASADLGLRLQELLRRNREGSLPRPSWWPPALAQVFWPLIALAALAALISLLLLPSLPTRVQPPPETQLRSSGSAAPAAPASTAGSSPPPSPGAALSPSATPSGSDRVPAPAAPEPSFGGRGPARRLRLGRSATSGLAAPTGTGSVPAGSAAPGVSSATLELPQPSPMGPGRAPAPAPAASPAPGPLDAPDDADVADAVVVSSARSRLRLALAEADPDGLIHDLRSDDPSATLSLALQDRFTSLAPAEQRRLALAWQARAAELAYERLELRDRQGRLLGRPARVGAGMVLLPPAG